MAQASTIRFGKALLMVGDGATPTEAFAAPCGFENLTMSVNIEANSVNIPDCSDPDLVAWLTTDVVSQQMVLSGDGVLDTAALATWQQLWFDNGGIENNYRWFRDIGVIADAGGYFEAPGVVTQWEEQGQRGNRWRVSLAVTLNGKPTWTENT